MAQPGRDGISGLGGNSPASSSLSPVSRRGRDVAAKIRSPCQQFSGGWARVFDVKDPIRHRKGYTLYKVVSKVYPTVAPEAVTEMIVWKRYSDFKKLHKEICDLHKSLHLRGKVPPFAKSQVFGRFEDSVIEARRKCAKELLDFVALHQPLFTSGAFTKFFEDDSRQIQVFDERDTLKEKPLVPPPPSSSYSSSSSSTMSASNDGSQERLCDVDGEEYVVVKSPGEDGEGREGEEELGSAERQGRVELPVTSVVVTEPTSPPPRGSPSPSLMVKSWSTSSFLSGVWRYRRDEDAISLSSDVSQHSEDDDGQGDVLRPSSSSVAAERVGLLVDGENSIEKLGRRSPSPCPPPPLSSSSSASTLLSEPRVGDYIFLAAEVVGSAQQAEAQGDFRTAFVKYKAGIGILLEGVQTDDDQTRRNAVRRKTAQYLERAELIYNAHLASTEELTWDDGISPHYSSHLLHLQVPVIELSRYKVLGVVGSVLLVLDATAGRTCVVKVLRKSSSSGLWICSGRRTIVPEDVPGMVRLYHFHETPSSIFLVLEHAKGGRLWDYLRRYSEMSRKALLGPATSDDPAPESRLPAAGERRRARTSPDDWRAGGDSNGEVEDTYLDLFRPDGGEGDAADSDGRGSSAAAAPGPGSGLVSVSVSRLGHRRCKSYEAGLTSPTHKTRLEPKSSFEGGGGDAGRGWWEGDGGGGGTERVLGPSPGLGGDLGSTWSQIIPESSVRRWGAEIVVAVACLHEKGIVCRDLNPSNVLLGSGGEVLLTYFAEWSCMNRDVHPSLVGSGYLAPEIVAGFAGGGSLPKTRPEVDDDDDHDRSGSPRKSRDLRTARAGAEKRNRNRRVSTACDWWSVGALLYELVTGTRVADVHHDLAWRQVSLRFPGHVSREACGVLSEFLRFEPKERLGAGVSGWEEIRRHPFFSDVNWSELLLRNPSYI